MIPRKKEAHELSNRVGITDHSQLIALGTQAEIESLATVICLSGGCFLLSDAIPDLSEETIRLISRLLPPIGRRPWVLDWFDRSTPSRIRLDLEGPLGAWSLIAYLNWADRPVSASLTWADYKLSLPQNAWAFDFWNQKVSRVSAGRIEIPSLAPHGIALFAVRPILENQPQYLGSDLHISQGLEITGWESTDSALRILLELPHQVKGNLFLSLPVQGEKPLIALNAVTKEAIRWENIENNVFVFHLEFDQRAELTLSY